MLTDPGDAHWSPDPVLRDAVGRSPASDLGLASSIREGGDTPRRLAGTPPVAWGMPGSFEGSPGRYTHLLLVDFQDASRRREMSREVHLEFLLARFPS